MGLLRNPLMRWFKQAVVNARLKRTTTGLILGENVTVSNSQIGNYCRICDGVRMAGSSLGNHSYIGPNSKVTRSSIGNFCSIGPHVQIALGIHPTNFVSTHPIFYSTSMPTLKRFATEQGFEEFGAVEIGHDVWIGANVIIVDNVKIGTGAIIATGAVVNKDVEPYSIVGGVPAKEIRKRFDPEQIQFLLESEWWNKSDEVLGQHHREFHSFAAFKSFILSGSPSNQER